MNLPAALDNTIRRCSHPRELLEARDVWRNIAHVIAMKIPGDTGGGRETEAERLKMRKRIGSVM